MAIHNAGAGCGLHKCKMIVRGMASLPKLDLYSNNLLLPVGSHVACVSCAATCVKEDCEQGKKLLEALTSN